MVWISAVALITHTLYLKCLTANRHENAMKMQSDDKQNTHEIYHILQLKLLIIIYSNIYLTFGLHKYTFYLTISILCGIINHSTSCWSNNLSFEHTTNDHQSLKVIFLSYSHGNFLFNDI